MTPRLAPIILGTSKTAYRPLQQTPVFAVRRENIGLIRNSRKFRSTGLAILERQSPGCDGRWPEEQENGFGVWVGGNNRDVGDCYFSKICANNKSFAQCLDFCPCTLTAASQRTRRPMARTATCQRSPRHLEVVGTMFGFLSNDMRAATVSV